MSVTARRRTVSRSPSDLLALYLHEIGAYPLLTRAEECRLASRVREGDEGALDELVCANLRFVVAIAKKYRHHGLALSDLINEGNLGLIRAAARFDETRGVKFISYAVWWVKQAILQAIAEQAGIVRVPMNRAGAIYRLGRRATALLQELGREATHAEIAEEMGMSEHEVTLTLSLTNLHVSLDAPVTPGEDHGLLDFIADESVVSPDAHSAEHELSRAIEGSLATLNEREARILRLYFGLGGGEPLTLEEIGGLLGVTRERVRQIKDHALGRLRGGRYARALESFA